MKIIQRVMSLAVAFFVIVCCVGAQEIGGLQSMRDALSEGRWSDAVTAYALLPSEDRAEPEASYLVAFALMRLNRPDAAKAYLLAAKLSGYAGYGGSWPTPDDLLRRVSVVERLRPPLFAQYKGNGRDPLIRVYGKDSEWLRYVASAMPQFLARGRSMFQLSHFPAASETIRL